MRESDSWCVFTVNPLKVLYILFFEEKKQKQVEKMASSVRMVAVSKSDIIIKVYNLNKTAASLIKDNGLLKMFNVISKASTIGNLFIANAARGHDIQSVPQLGNTVFFQRDCFHLRKYK